MKILRNKRRYVRTVFLKKKNSNTIDIEGRFEYTEVPAWALDWLIVVYLTGTQKEASRVHWGERICFLEYCLIDD